MKRSDSLSINPRPLPPLLLRAEPADKNMKTISTRVMDSEKDAGRYIYLCRDCGARITSQSCETAVNSKHVHVFSNPHGKVFEIGCFSDAAVMVIGPATIEFTWFQGFSWNIVICRSCRRHLGWLYTRGENHFYGLILQALVKQESGKT